MAAPDATRTSAGPASTGSRLWLHGLICGALVVIAAPAMLLVAVLALPALLAAIAERTPGRPMARNLALAAAAVSLPALAALWHAGHGWPAALALASDTGRLAAAWAAQAGFWLLGEVTPLLIGAALEARARAQAARLRARRAEYERQWGLAPPDPPAG